MKNLKISPALAGIALAMLPSPIAQIQVRQAALWKNRKAAWVSRYKWVHTYRHSIEVYQASIPMLVTSGQSPDVAAVEYTEDWQMVTFTIKQVMERVLNTRLCDINPDDAIALSKQTAYSAEQWYLGCTDEGHYVPL